MTDKALLYKITACIHEVHKTLGPGLLESIYEHALMYEFKQIGLKAENQKHVPVIYKGVDLMPGDNLKLDIIVEDRIIIELKSVEKFDKVHFKQLETYLRLMNLYQGILVNFNCKFIDKENYRTIYNSALRPKDD